MWVSRQCGVRISTNKPTKRRTKGSKTKTIGKANIQETNHADNQSPKKPSTKPKFLIILIIEMMALIKQERKKGIKIPAYFRGSLGILPMIFVV